MSVLEEAFSIKDELLELRNWFHMHPELGLKEFETARRIEHELDKKGIKHYRVGETNVIAEIDTGRPGKTLFLRADIDALPITEANDVPYKSRNKGVMHACGHDGHTAYLLGAAGLILNHLSELSGKIILAFQAAEEIGQGARTIIDAGVLDHVDRVFGIHFGSKLPVGKYSVRAGSDMASCDKFTITVHGKSAHITSPQFGVDSVFIGALITAQLQTVVSRLISPAEGGLIGTGSFHSGTSYNIIPGEAVLEGTIRAFTKESRKKLADAVKKIATDIATQYGGSADVVIEDFCDPCVNSPETAEEVISSARKLVGVENVVTNPEKRFISDNFADFMRKAPGTYAQVGATDSEKTAWPLHSDHWDLAEDSTVYAAALALQYALDYLGENNA